LVPRRGVSRLLSPRDRLSAGGRTRERRASARAAHAAGRRSGPVVCGVAAPQGVCVASRFGAPHFAERLQRRGRSRRAGGGVPGSGDVTMTRASILAAALPAAAVAIVAWGI